MRGIFYFLQVLLIPLSAPALAEWKNESEAGVVVTTGNSRTQSLNGKTQTDYKFDKNLLRLQGNYLQSRQNDALSALSWSIGLRYERELKERLSIFLGQSGEGDKFAGVLQRYNTDLGAKYFFFKSEKDFIWFSEAGYRFTSEHSTNGTTKSYQKARLYSEAEKFWTEHTSTKFWVEYIPNFTLSKAWLLNSELSLASSLTSVFSLKTAYQVRYNNAPSSSSAKKMDTSFTTALVARY